MKLAGHWSIRAVSCGARLHHLVLLDDAHVVWVAAATSSFTDFRG